MNQAIIGKYSYLWDGSQTGWVIVDDAFHAPVIFNEDCGVMLHIDSAELKSALLTRMKQAGARIVSRAPVVPLVVIRGKPDSEDSSPRD